MHMADALLSPPVGGALWASAAAMIAYSSHKVKQGFDDRKVPLMGVMGAFIFAAQMINFTIPATGSSGHLGGGMILAILLGPHAAFLTLSSILTVQALFFADGGLLALGCNIVNLGFFPCYVAYPLVYKSIVNDYSRKGRVFSGTIAASVVGLQLGAAGVVLETFFSGIAELPVTTFALLMLPIHLAIGIVEGVVTAAVVGFIQKARPDIVSTGNDRLAGNRSLRAVIVGLLAVTIMVGGGLSWFASTHPDGLEWAMVKTAGREELHDPEQGIFSSLSRLQEKTALMPDYGFKSEEDEPADETHPTAEWPAVNRGTSVAGLVGGAMTLVVAGVIGWGLRRRRNTKQ